MFDVLIVGGGVAGITAGIYGARAGKKVAIIERFVPGGQIDSIGLIENYPGFKSVTGSELAESLFNHAKSAEVEFIFDEVVGFDLNRSLKKVVCLNQTYEAQSIILAMGSASRELNISGEKKFFGKGVSYCAMCDGNFFKGKSVAVVGSGDSAVSNSLYLSNICKEVFLLSKNNLKLQNYTEEDLQEKDNIKVYKNVQTKAFKGDEKLEKVMFVDGEEEKECVVEGAFVAIGRTPPTEILENEIELDHRGYIVCGDDLQTSKKGVFACGDVVSGSIKQIVVAGGMGVLALNEALKYVALKNKK